MFRKITNSAPCHQPLQKVEDVVKKQIKGGTIIQKSVSFENPQQRIDFDEFSLQDLLDAGIKLEQINTKVIDNNNFDVLNDVSLETTKEPQEESPF